MLPIIGFIIAGLLFLLGCFVYVSWIAHHGLSIFGLIFIVPSIVVGCLSYIGLTCTCLCSCG